MARKHVPIHEPMQLGFGFEVLDEKGEAPPFLYEEQEVYAALDQIAQAQWVSVDVETTGLTEASMPVSLNKVEIKQGSSNRVRMRTIQARIPTVNGRSGPRLNFAFDTDKMSSELTQHVAEIILKRRIFIAHNAGFDLYWLRRAQGRTVMPPLVVDTMLITRLLNPQIVLERSYLIEGVSSPAQAANSDSEVVQEAWKSLISGASGGSLADVVLAMFEVAVPKQYQMPRNWTGLLGFDHYDYAIDDVVWADRILCNLLNLEIDEGDILQGYLGVRARQASVRLIEPQVPDLVRLREKGMPFNQDVGLRYAKRKERELAKCVDALISLEPSLEDFREALSNPNVGLSDALKVALAAAFEARGVALRYTAATRTPQIGEKDLRACRAARIEEAKPLFSAWVDVCKAKKMRQMALETVGFAQRGDDGRLHSLMSHGPVTGRLSAAEPNCQQWPRDPLFRAMCMSDTEEGKETSLLVADEFDFGLLSKVLDRKVLPGEEVEVDSSWLAALFYSESDRYSWPSEKREEFEAFIWGMFTHIIIASDFGALDVRVGAALCIRSQREMIDLANGIAVPGITQPSDEVVRVVKDVVPLLDVEKAIEELADREASYFRQSDRIQKRLDTLKEDFDADRIQARQFFTQRRRLMDEQLVLKLGWRLSQCLGKAVSRGERDYSALRDAFVADIDIHTFTGMKLAGRDPMQEFEGLSHSELKKLERVIRSEIGEGRQQGKIANLSLLYGMGDAGFQEAAASGYDEHWTLEEAREIRSLWMDAYPEVELWQLWTECLKTGEVYLPERGKDRLRRTSWWLSRTLGGRDIVALGINSALSYQDQSSGADILGLIMHTLERDYPHIFETTINQVHDEQVFSVPKELYHEYLPIIEKVMVDVANSLTMPYGVPTTVGPASAPLWVSD